MNNKNQVEMTLIKNNRWTWLVQTEQCFDDIITSLPMDMSISNITSEASARTTFSSTTSKSLLSNNNIELSYYRLSKLNQSRSVCKTCLSTEKKNSMDNHKKIRAECLINHRIFIAEKSTSCTTHVCDDSLVEDIEVIKKSKIMLCSFEQDKLIETFSLVKMNLQNLKSKLNDIAKKLILSLGVDSTFNASNYYMLTGLILEQFNEFCSKPPLTDIKHTNLRSPRSAIASLLVKLRLGLNPEVLATLFGFRSRRM